MGNRKAKAVKAKPLIFPEARAIIKKKEVVPSPVPIMENRRATATKKSEGSANKHHARSGHGYKKGHGSHGGHGGHGKCPFSHLLRFKDKIGLTEAQVAEIKQLRFEYQKQSIRNKAEHKIAHMEFDELVHAEKVDAPAILTAAGKIAETKMEKIMNMAKAKINLLNLLTDEQRKKAHTAHSTHH